MTRLARRGLVIILIIDLGAHLLGGVFSLRKFTVKICALYVFPPTKIKTKTKRKILPRLLNVLYCLAQTYLLHVPQPSPVFSTCPSHRALQTLSRTPLSAGRGGWAATWRPGKGKGGHSLRQGNAYERFQVLPRGL